MKQIPSTLIAAAICILVALWPSLQPWTDATVQHHWLIHGLFLIGGGLIGLQTSWWMHPAASLTQAQESGVSS